MCLTQNTKDTRDYVNQNPRLCLQLGTEVIPSPPSKYSWEASKWCFTFSLIRTVLPIHLYLDIIYRQAMNNGLKGKLA